MLQGIERYLKQAIVDKNASVSSASLVSALVSVSVQVGTVVIESSGSEAKNSYFGRASHMLFGTLTMTSGLLRK